MEYRPYNNELPQPDPAIEAWTRATLQSLVISRSAVGVGCLLLSGVLLWLTWRLWWWCFFLTNAEVISPHKLADFEGDVTMRTWVAFSLTILAYLVIQRTWSNMLEVGSWMSSFARMLLVGPSTASWSVVLFRQAWIAWSADAPLIGRLLKLMLASERRVPFARLEELVGSQPKSRWLAPLLLINDGVHLHSHPPGLTLTDDLKKSLEAVRRPEEELPI